MRQPIRKGSKYTFRETDYYLTSERYDELKKRLDYFVKIKRPREAAEVQRLALMGDFSENAGYQLAKSRLRGLNQRIIDLENLLNRAQIIAPQSNNEVDIGHRVTITNGEQEKVFLILGATETNPGAGVISYQSRLGAALLGKKVGADFIWSRPKGEQIWKIKSID
ncbi:MAG: GreA/GreB family elongation factor [Patescibacteria group bacterium]|jgi:transcription elongation factor GreA